MSWGTRNCNHCLEAFEKATIKGEGYEILDIRKLDELCNKTKKVTINEKRQ